MPAGLSRFFNLKLCLIGGICFSPLSLVFGQAFSFKHPTCVLKYVPLSGEWLPFQKTLEAELQKRNFKYTAFETRKRLEPGDLYLELTMQRLHEKMYKDCQVEMKLKLAKEKLPLSKDKVLYETQGVRRFPRVTFKGNERCHRAINDAFVHIPTCKSK